jgi:hypothetical protein
MHLGLMNYRILVVDEQENDVTIKAELITPPSYCAHCESGLFYKHGVKQQLVMDLLDDYYFVRRIDSL